jgi:hypothetical protein
VLEVVQDDEPLPAAEVGDHRVEQRRAGLAQAEGAGQRGQYQRRAGHRRQLHDGDREPDRAGDVEGEAGLTDPAQPGECDQPLAAE